VLLAGLASLSIGGTAYGQFEPPETGQVTPLTIGPSIGISQLFTDNAAGTAPAQPEFVTQITPGLSINGETARAKVDFNYLPTFNHFENGDSKDRVDQNLNANGMITPITDKLVVDFQAYANEANASGNASNQQGILVPTDNRILYYIGNIAPHYHQQYGDLATLDVTYSLDSTNTSVEGAKLPGLGINSTNSLGRNALVSIGSADAFGRLGLRADFSHSDNSGSGANTESTTGVDTVGLSYHFNRVFSLSMNGGYQSIDYPANGSTPAYKSNGVTWSVGLTITPNALSTVSIGYGKQQGSYNPSIQVGYSLGPRTNVSASYLVSVQNQLTSTLQNLRYLVYDQFGNPIDSRTGLPFSGIDQSFGSQNVLFRDKPALISLSHQLTRSSVTLTGKYEVRDSLSGVSINTKAMSASLNYTRQLTPLIQGNMNLGYTHITSKTFGSPEEDSDSVSLSGQLLYNLSGTTTISVVEDFFRTTSSTPASSSQSQQLTVGLRKSF
jgi:uncharacterized protein (PEP-CTERM system associated)